jgi:hypothetical protein
MPKKSHVTKYTAARNVIAGLEKRWSARAKLTVHGKDYSREELVRLFRSQIEALEAIRVARAALTFAVAREREIARQVESQIPKLRLTVHCKFGSSPDVLADFGWTQPKKPGPKTVAAKVAGAEKLRATRKARQTMGKKQRKKVRAPA